MISSVEIHVNKSEVDITVSEIFHGRSGILSPERLCMNSIVFTV